MNISNIFPWGAHAWQTALVSAIGNTAVLYNITGTLAYLQQVLAQVGPMLSAVLFIIAGVFYAVGQMLPPDKKANFHTTSVNIIIGAIVVAVLSVTSSGLALASTHLLANMSMNATANAIR
ncbi:MAG: hypothetical protein KGH61_01425 [Candidatus Micrarchaeota archaeon]|nr:hypothetical protein [Candidatus Micrarchaeota archaeon]MDE1847591.1 hypothetical protein [Candidatus Micrarchaeota archaeon]MDE1864823.1 hypothetical protein [Candidatus Micrarchaeota archaeon]